MISHFAPIIDTDSHCEHAVFNNTFYAVAILAGIVYVAYEIWRRAAPRPMLRGAGEQKFPSRVVGSRDTVPVGSGGEVPQKLKQNLKFMYTL